jgi:hypothetical protein
MVAINPTAASLSFVRIAPTGVAWQPASRQLRPVGPMAGSSSLCMLWCVICTSLAATTTSSTWRGSLWQRGLPTRAGAGPDFNSHFDFTQESSQAPKKSRKRRKASEADGKSRKISSFCAQK